MIESNKDVAELLYKYSDMLEVSGASIYRVRAYRKAARGILAYKHNVLEIPHFDFQSIPGIGDGIARLIDHIISTGSLPAIKEKENSVVPRKRARKFLRISHAIPVAELIEAYLRAIETVESVACCGAYRRKKEVIESIDFIVSTAEPLYVFQKIAEMQEVSSVISQGEQSICLLLLNGVLVNLYQAQKREFGSRLLELTGSSKTYAGLVQMAEKKGEQLTSQGLFHGNTYLAGESEEAIFNQLNLQYIEPELREGTTEIDLAKKKQLPALIELNDIQGDLHSHTVETDGKETLETMANAAYNLGYSYFAITDHSKRLTIAHGMDEKRLLQQIQEIDRLNAQFKDFVILKSMEIDILEDGSLDLEESVLKELDVVLCSIHSKFRISQEKQTERILRAMDNPYFNILGHATGRLIKSRPPYEIDMERILLAAKERGCFIELNCQPYRLDINDIYCRMAKEIGVKIAISSDAHSVKGLNYMTLGINQARRGWLEKKDVINTYAWPDLKKLLRRI